MLMCQDTRGEQSWQWRRKLKYNSRMAKKLRGTKIAEPTQWFRGADIPMAVIRRFASDVAERFKPNRIILFGSYAYGDPHADSDVDILVVMPARNELDQAFKIHWAIQPPFPVQLLVRTPKNIKWRLAEGESFLTEVLAKGKVLYEANNEGMGAKGRSRPSDSKANQRRQNTSS